MAWEAAPNPKIAAGVQDQSAEINDVLSDRSSGPHVDEDVSPGVARAAAINRNMTRTDRIGVFVGVFLIAYAYGLDGTIRSTYQVQQQVPLNLPRLTC